MSLFNASGFFFNYSLKIWIGHFLQISNNTSTKIFLENAQVHKNVCLRTYVIEETGIQYEIRKTGRILNGNH